MIFFFDSNLLSPCNSDGKKTNPRNRQGSTTEGKKHLEQRIASGEGYIIYYWRREAADSTMTKLRRKVGDLEIDV